mgnify:CR=1 FL=1
MLPSAVSSNGGSGNGRDRVRGQGLSSSVPETPRSSSARSGEVDGGCERADHVAMAEYAMVTAAVALLAATLVGIETPSSAKNLEIKPYAIAGLSNIDFISSTSGDGFSSVVVSFTDKADDSKMASDVERRVSNITSKFPSGVRTPTVQKIDLSAVPVMQLAVVDDVLTTQELSTVVDDTLLPAIEQISELLSELQQSRLQINDIINGKLTDPRTGRSIWQLTEDEARPWIASLYDTIDKTTGAQVPMDPAAAVLHYAQEIFEGLKAYKNADGSVTLFRPLEN